MACIYSKDNQKGEHDRHRDVPLAVCKLDDLEADLND